MRVWEAVDLGQKYKSKKAQQGRAVKTRCKCLGCRLSVTVVVELVDVCRLAMEKMVWCQVVM